MYLLDTNVISEIRKAKTGKADPRVAAWAKAVRLADLFVSVIAIQEIEIGVLLAERRDPRQGRLLRTWLDVHLLGAFADRVLPVDLPVARRSAQLHVPATRPVRDALFAATAMVHDMTVVTRNVADFSPTGVRILNPWESPAA